VDFSGGLLVVVFGMPINIAPATIIIAADSKVVALFMILSVNE
jgi:hypothetical protein